MTCADAEILICDYLDGALTGAQREEFERHLSACPGCAELLKDASAALAFIERASEIEPPPELLTRIYQIPGRAPAIRSWFHRLIHPILQPRLVMGLSLTILSFAMMARCVGIQERQLSPADLSPVRVWAGIEDRAQRGWERSVKFYENIRFVYKLQTKVREWQQQQEQESGPPPAEKKADSHKLQPNTK